MKSVSARNAALEKLSSQIRSLVGADYPLGAIIPSPVGLSHKGSYWGNFPYQMLAEKYDVFVPMSYYTYHGDGSDGRLQRHDGERPHPALEAGLHGRADPPDRWHRRSTVIRRRGEGFREGGQRAPSRRSEPLQLAGH